MRDIQGAQVTRGATRRAETAGGVSRAQLTRLFRLVVILQSERYPNARELAESCEVSRRTVHPDRRPEWRPVRRAGGRPGGRARRADAEAAAPALVPRGRLARGSVHEVRSLPVTAPRPAMVPRRAVEPAQACRRDQRALGLEGR